jgi:hypothetical protein
MRPKTKTLTILAPMFAIVALMAIPTMAQAELQMQCGTVECANGATLKGQSSNLKVQLQTGATDEGELKCTSSTFTGTLASSQGNTIEGGVTSDALSGCTAKGISADVQTNVSAAHPARLKGEMGGGGKVTVTLLPNSQQTKLRATAQLQVFGFSVATCVFGAESAQRNVETQTDTESGTQLEAVVLEESNSSECGTVGTTKGDISGSGQLEDTSGNAVVVHSI